MKDGWFKTRVQLLPVLVLLSACSQSPQDRLVELGRCYKAGLALNDRALLKGVEIELPKVTGELKEVVSPAQFAMVVNERINEELYLLTENILEVMRGEAEPNTHLLRVEEGDGQLLGLLRSALKHLVTEGQPTKVQRSADQYFRGD